MNNLKPEDVSLFTYWPAAVWKSAWVSKDDYGVTLIHNPTGVSVSCHEDARSIHRNKAQAWKELTEEVNKLGYTSQLELF